MLRERFKWQPLLFEEKLKVNDPELALPTAVQAALSLCSRCDEKQELTGALESDGFPVNGCILSLPGHSQSEFLEENAKIPTCPGCSLAARAFLRCVWLPSSKQPFGNLPSLSLNSQLFLSFAI